MIGKTIDITGQRFGRLVAIEPVGKNSSHNTLWRCKCDCGSEIITTGTCLRQGVTKSCGCLHSEVASATNRARSRGLTIKKEQPPEIAINTPINKDSFTDWWMFGEQEVRNERWFNKYIA